MTAVWTSPLVGRELDLAVALEQLKRIERGLPAALLVRGEAGIGKSRLVGELATRAEQLGYPVVAGGADDLDRGIPYAVFRDLLARLATESSRADQAAAAEVLHAAIEADHADADHLSAAFAAATRLMRSVGGGGPVVVVLEDLHVADGESLALAALLIRLADPAALIVATLRPGLGAVDLERLCERMAFDGRGAVVDLEALDRHETRALAGAVMGAALDDESAAAVFEASGATPSSPARWRSRSWTAARWSSTGPGRVSSPVPRRRTCARRRRCCDGSSSAPRPTSNWRRWSPCSAGSRSVTSAWLSGSPAWRPRTWPPRSTVS